MRLDQEVSFGVGVLLVLQLLTAFAAIGLFARMGPALEHILVENVASNEAAGEMLAVLVAPPVDARGRFRAALAQARGNITDPREVQILEQVEALAEPALAGDVPARMQVISALDQLTVVNRQQMEEANHDASELGRAGAWTAVLLGVVTFLVGQLVYRRLRTRLERPVLDLDSVLDAARTGDVHRRCVMLEAPRELERAAQNLNWLLDLLLRQRDRVEEERLRAVLLHLLDAREPPTLVVEARDGILAMNRSALELLDTEQREGGLIDALRAGREPPGWNVDRIGRTGVRIATRVE